MNRETLVECPVCGRLVHFTKFKGEALRTGEPIMRRHVADGGFRHCEGSLVSPRAAAEYARKAASNV